MSNHKNDSSLINYLLESSNVYTKKSDFKLRSDKVLNNPIIQHHINALIIELMPLLKGNTKAHIKSGSGKMNNAYHQYKVSETLPLISIVARVPNIKINTDFSEKIIIDDEYNDLVVIKSEFPKNLHDLKFDIQKSILSGNTDKVGTHEILLFGYLPLADGTRQRIKVALKVSFIPDPKSLWKNIPSNTSERFHKPDMSELYCENDDMLLMASSVRGRSHAHKGTHRDDDFSLYCDNSSDWIVSCVADGAGSCKFSRQGAYVASDKATSTLAEALKGPYGKSLEQAYNNFEEANNDESQKLLAEAYQHTVVKAVHEAVKSIQSCINPKEEDSFKDFSTTLILAAHKKVEGGYLVISFWIGDGGVVIYDKNKSVILMGDPDSGEFAGQTRFLDYKLFEGDGSEAYKRVRMKKVESMTALILATDGITDAWFDTEKELESLAKWDELWAQLEPNVINESRGKGLKGLTDWMNFWSVGNHDDRTISICLVKE